MILTLRDDAQVYGSTLPTGDWDPALSLENFETFRQVTRRRDELINILQAGNSAAQQVAETLASCKKVHRCRSATCPVCGRMFRRRWGGQVAQMIGNDPHRWTAVSLVNSADKYAVGDLHSFSPKLAKDRLRKQISRTAKNSRSSGESTSVLNRAGPTALFGVLTITSWLEVSNQIAGML